MSSDPSSSASSSSSDTDEGLVHVAVPAHEHDHEELVVVTPPSEEEEEGWGSIEPHHVVPHHQFNTHTTTTTFVPTIHAEPPITASTDAPATSTSSTITSTTTPITSVTRPLTTTPPETTITSTTPSTTPFTSKLSITSTSSPAAAPTIPSTPTPTPTSAPTTTTTTSQTPATSTSSPSPQVISPQLSINTPPLAHIIIPTYIHPSPSPPSPSLASTIPLSTSPSHAQHVSDHEQHPSPSNVPGIGQGMMEMHSFSDHSPPASPSPSSSSSPPRITLGPIIGRVTHDTARILVEVSHACILTLVVAQEGNQVLSVAAPPSPSAPDRAIVTSTPSTSSHLPISRSQTQSLEPDTPTIFIITSLHPDTRYQITMTSDIRFENMTVATFHTPSIHTQRLRVAMVANDAPITETSYMKLWSQLSSLNRDVDVLLLSLPIDTPSLYQLCYNQYLRFSEKTQAQTSCRNLISHTYRATWSNPNITSCLSHIQTLFIPHLSFHNIKPCIYHTEILQDMKEIQTLYEKQLWSDVDEHTASDDSSYHTWSDSGIGLILLSSHSSSLTKLTHELTSGSMSTISHLMIALDQPLIIHGTRNICICEGLCHKKYEPIPLASSPLRDSILSLLSTWIQHGQRQITFITPNGKYSATQHTIVHECGSSSLSLSHITSGPISSPPLSSLSHAWDTFIHSLYGSRINHDHIISSTSYTPTRNFVILDIDMNENICRVNMITEEGKQDEKQEIEHKHDDGSMTIRPTQPVSMGPDSAAV